MPNKQILDIYYYIETQSYISIFTENNNHLFIYKINESKKYDERYEENFVNNCNNLKSFDLKYNKSIEGYDLISDCNINTNWKIIYNISIFSSFSNHTFVPIEDNFEFIVKEVEEEEEKYKKEEKEEVYEEEYEEVHDKIEEEEKYNKIEEEEYNKIEEKEEYNKIEEENDKIEEEEYKKIEEENDKIEEEIKDIIDTIITSNIKENEIIEIEKNQKTELNITKEELMENLTKVITLIEVGKSYEYTGEDFNLVIKPTNASFLESETHVNFTQCENTLRKTFNISSSRILTFLQIETENKNEKSLVNKVEHQVYDDNKKLLDLSICNDSNIQIFHAIKDNSLIDINSISNLKI